MQLKERAEKLEYHKMREKKIMEKKKEKNELLRRQSSIWIDEVELEKKISNAILDSTPLWIVLTNSNSFGLSVFYFASC